MIARRGGALALICLISGFVAGCGENPSPTPAIVAPAISPDQLVGKWGFAAYHKDEDRARTIKEAAAQCNRPYVIAKGAIDALHARGLPAFKADAARLMGLPIARLAEIASFDDVKLLSVAVDRLERWRRPGFLAIGDAAHAATPNLGQGGAMAVEDALVLADAFKKLGLKEAAWKHFQQSRRKKVDWTVSTSRSIGKICHLGNPLFRSLRNIALKKTPDRVTQKQVQRIYSLESTIDRP